MSKFKFPGHGDVIKSIEEQLEKDVESRNEEIRTHTELILNTSINCTEGTNQLVKTEAAQKWLTALREERNNPFLGKEYMARAPEYEREDETIKESAAMSDEEANKILETDENGKKYIPDDYNPNIEEEADEIDDGARKMINLAVISKTVQHCIGWNFEDVLKECADALEEEFGDDFILPDNFDEVVNKSLEHAETVARIEYQNREKVKNNNEMLDNH